MPNRVRIPLYVTIALDPAVTKKDYSNASGFTINGCSKNDVWYTLLAENFRGRPDEVVDRAVYHAMQYPAQVMSCEIIAAQRLFIPMLQDAFQKCGIKCAVLPYKYSTRLSKHARISSLQPRAKSGKWFFLKGKCDALINQMLQYPEGEDDLIDSMVQHTQFARPFVEGSRQERLEEADEDDEDTEGFWDQIKNNGSFVGRGATKYDV